MLSRLHSIKDNKLKPLLLMNNIADAKIKRDVLLNSLNENAFKLLAH